MTLIDRLPPLSKQLQGIQVLVVDNDRDSNVLYRVLLHDCGATVVICGSIGEAVASFAWFSPQILLSEMRFRGESIETLLTKLQDRERNGGQPLTAIAITTSITASLTQTLNDRFDDWLLKPIDLDKLVSMMQRFVTQERQ